MAYALSERAKGIRLPPTTATRRVLAFIGWCFLFLTGWRGASAARRPGSTVAISSSAASLGGQRLGPQPPAGERLGGAEQGGGEGLDFGPGGLAAALRQLRQHRAGDEVEDPPAVLGDPLGDLAAARQRLVEQHRPGGAVGVEEGEEGADAGAERLGGAVGGGDRLGDGRGQRVAARSMQAM